MQSSDTNINSPKVSIIVPVFNVAAYLPKCLDSLLNQPFKDIEIICFNDASTDNSLEILKNYQIQDPRIKIIDSKVNVRQGAGRNHCIKKSKGEYLMFVDSDDWVTPDFVELLYTNIKSSESDIVTADYYESKNGNLTEISLLGLNLKMKDDDLKRLILRNGCRLVTSIFKKELFTENSLFFPEGVIYEDNAIGAPLFLRAKKITKLDKYLYYYRVDNYSTTRSLNNYKFFDRLQTSVMMLDNCKRIGVYETFKKEIDSLFFKLYYTNSIYGAIFNFSPIQYQKIKEITSTLPLYMEKNTIKECLKQINIKIRAALTIIKISPYFGSRLIKFALTIKNKH